LFPGFLIVKKRISQQFFCRLIFIYFIGLMSFRCVNDDRMNFLSVVRFCVKRNHYQKKSRRNDDRVRL